MKQSNKSLQATRDGVSSSAIAVPFSVCQARQMEDTSSALACLDSRQCYASDRDKLINAFDPQWQHGVRWWPFCTCGQ